MNELITINNNGGKKTVSARELYLGLGLDKSNWSKWSVRNIVNNDFFAEHADWEGFVLITNGNETMDYEITIDFAKHLAMMARTEKSHEYRNYFIECERRLANVRDSYMIEDPVERALAWAEEQRALRAVIEEKEETINVLEDRLRLTQGMTNNVCATLKDRLFMITGKNIWACSDEYKRASKEILDKFNAKKWADIRQRDYNNLMETIINYKL